MSESGKSFCLVYVLVKYNLPNYSYSICWFGGNTVKRKRPVQIGLIKHYTSPSESFLQMIDDHVKELFGGMEGDEEVVSDLIAPVGKYISLQRNLYTVTP